MHAAQDVTNPAPIHGPLLAREQDRKGVASGMIFLSYILVLAGVSVHLYRQPIYSMDSIQYMANALLMEERDPVRIHQRVYAEVQQFVPKATREGLLGHEVGAPEYQNESRLERAKNPDRLMEFLPLFAIRPLYNQTLWLVSKTGLGLVRSGILLSVTSYFLLGVLAFTWLRKYMSAAFTLGFSVLVMVSPPLTGLGRITTSDSLATLVAFASLYLIFEERRLLPGMILLLASIYFRTDFVMLAGPVLLACWMEHRIDFWKTGALALMAVASALSINHFAGHYGIGYYYLRSGVPVSPGEITVQLPLKDYVSGLRGDLTLMTQSFFVPFLLLGATGMVLRRTRALFAVTLAYALLHFLIVPVWLERYFGVFYLSMAVCAATMVGTAQRNTAVDAGRRDDEGEGSHAVT